MGSKFRSPLPELTATEMMGVLKPGENVLANITEAAQQKVNASYVYDQVTGLKIFGKVAYYSQEANGALAAFMRKTDADTYAGKTKGKVVTYADALTNAKLAAAAPVKVAASGR